MIKLIVCLLVLSLVFAFWSNGFLGSDVLRRRHHHIGALLLRALARLSKPPLKLHHREREIISVTHHSLVVGLKIEGVPLSHACEEKRC